MPPGIVMIGPGSEQPQSPQLASILMGEDVIGIIGAGCKILEGTDGLSGYGLAGDGGNRPVVSNVNSAEDAVQIPLDKSAPLTLLVREFCVVRDL